MTSVKICLLDPPSVPIWCLEPVVCKNAVIAPSNMYGRSSVDAKTISALQNGLNLTSHGLNFTTSLTVLWHC